MTSEKHPTSQKHQLATIVDQGRQLLRRDPRKAAVVAVLAAVMVVMWGRLLLNSGPALASASLAAQPGQVGTAMDNRTYSLPRGRVSLTQWIAEPKGSFAGRNLFQLHLENFTSDGSSRGKHSGFDEFNDQAKSASIMTDQVKQRQIVLQNLEARAGQLRLQSTLMGTKPKAVIDGELVSEGDTLSSFRIVKIEPRRVIVELDGVQLPIAMK